VGDSTREPLVRLAEDGSVLLPVDRAVFFGEHDTLDPENALVRVSPARALQLLDGLQALRPELSAAMAAQSQRTALRAAVELVIAEPLLAGWSAISENNYDVDRGRHVQVLYHREAAVPDLERYAEKVGAEVVRQTLPNADWFDVWVGSAGQGWISLHCQYAYYPDGRPELADTLAAAIEEVAAVAREQDSAAAEQVDQHLAFNPHSDRHETGGDEVEYADESDG
jgi:hypothetical protein